MINVQIKKQKAIRGFIGTTYAVWKDKKLVGIFSTKQQAETFKQVVLQRG